MPTRKVPRLTASSMAPAWAEATATSAVTPTSSRERYFFIITKSPSKKSSESYCWHGRTGRHGLSERDANAWRPWDLEPGGTLLAKIRGDEKDWKTLSPASRRKGRIAAPESVRRQPG
ncbi:hypothetical protein BR1R5_42670 [Pseudomonas sp. BR1R-5]|nr:hypothetical protein BR1R5_42670 [Pseudomonas sp. BR1R-5]